ncbi:hypothetical protein ACP70R_025670 [Stipagrostis hirtigluma subsp. patula]
MAIVAKQLSPSKAGKAGHALAVLVGCWSRTYER